MTPGPLQAIAPGATSQLVALLVSVLTAVAVVGLVAGGLWLWRRRLAATVPPAPVTGDEPPADPTARAVRRLAVRRLLGVVLVLALVLPATMVIRQLWPHPDLGPRLVPLWLLVVLPPVIVWLASVRTGRERRPRS